MFSLIFYRQIKNVEKEFFMKFLEKLQKDAFFTRDNFMCIGEWEISFVKKQQIELDNFEQFVLFKIGVIENLDYTKSHNRGFVYYLMDYCERFCSESAIVHLYRIIQNNKLNIGSRLDAAMLYLYNVPSNQTFVDRFNDICSKFQTAINEEDDSDIKAIASFLNYYSYVVNNTSEQFSRGIFLKYTNAIENDSFPFLKNDVIQECLALDYYKPEILYDIVQKKIDELLGRNEEFIIQPNRENDYLIESDTDYARILNNTPRTFQAIRNISVQQINQFDNKDDVYHSLGRGVKILKEEEQLYSYISSYGNMHEAKMLSALHKLPLAELEGKNIEIFDWACGQGLASIIMHEYVSNQDVDINIKNVILIEPSEIALNRAALHVRHFNSKCQIRTHLKDINSVTQNDLNCDKSVIKIHLFSNILDVDGFSIEHLISIIEQTQKGENYFVCVSPYITDAKTARIDKFVQHFSNKHDSYHSYFEIENQKGEWKNNWTRVIRVFRVCF